MCVLQSVHISVNKADLKLTHTLWESCARNITSFNERSCSQWAGGGSLAGELSASALGLGSGNYADVGWRGGRLAGKLPQHYYLYSK